jgi:pyruvate formate lyase activating enzyme
MKLKIFQKGFNYSQDGPGNRLVYHLQGCNMRCGWCSNPEGLSINGTLIINNKWLLDSFCPHGAIQSKALDRSICEGCRTRECITLNKNKGIRLSCEEYEIDEIVEETVRSAPLFYDGGGVTLTGGEATLQFNEITELLEKLKDKGINTAIETNSTHPKLETLFPLIDTLIMDMKHYDDELHKAVTGVGNSIIKKNFAKAFTYHKNVLIRIPVIKGVNDSEKDIKGFVNFFKQHNTENASFEFLAYHEYGKAKWLQCGMTYKMTGAYVEQSILLLYKNIFSENGLSVVHT